MKKIIVLILCVIVLSLTMISVSAEGDNATTEAVATEQATSVATEAEIATEAEFSGATEAVAESTEASTDKSWIPDKVKTVADKIVDWIKERLTEISMVITMVMSVFYQMLKNRKLNKSITTLNNNSVTITERSNAAIKENLEIVQSYKDEMAALLAEVRETAEEKKETAKALKNADSLLKNARAANVELSNVLAELLVLANIPNSKKEELYSRHRNAVAKMEDADEAEVKE